MPIHEWTMVQAGTFHNYHFRWVAAIVDAVILCILLAVAVLKFKEYRRVMTEAEIELAAETAKTAPSRIKSFWYLHTQYVLIFHIV